MDKDENLNRLVEAWQYLTPYQRKQITFNAWLFKAETIFYISLLFTLFIFFRMLVPFPRCKPKAHYVKPYGHYSNMQT